MRTEKLVEILKRFGYKTYYRKCSCGCYAYYTDGTRIGYVQFDGVYFVATVHVAVDCSGTGFSIGRFSELTKETLESGLSLAPSWCNGSTNSIVKYKNWDAFHNRDAFNQQLVKG